MKAKERRRSIGIGITTHNRNKQLTQLLTSIRDNTDSSVEVAVFDDGDSCHDTIHDKSLCSHYFKKPSKGIAENKNRALYFFCEVNPVKRILLLEDDLLITDNTWLKKWKKAIDLHGHINLSFPGWAKNDESFKGGRGTPRSPDRWTKVSGMVIGANTAIMRESVGYMNPLFSGYGHEHLEWTERWISQGYGGRIKGKNKRIYFSLTPKGIALQDFASTSIDFDTTKNRIVHVSLRKQGHPPIKEPWESAEQKDFFLAAFESGARVI